MLQRVLFVSCQAAARRPLSGSHAVHIMLRESIACGAHGIRLELPVFADVSARKEGGRRCFSWRRLLDDNVFRLYQRRERHSRKDSLIGLGIDVGGSSARWLLLEDTGNRARKR